MILFCGMSTRFSVMDSSTDPARHSLYLALGAIGFFPATLVLLVAINALLNVLGVSPPEALGLFGASVFFLAIPGSVICVPVGLAALGSYRRQTAPSVRRSVWTILVLILLVPMAWAAATMFWGVVVS